MRLRSTGLGRTELEADVVNVKKVDDLVVFFVDCTKPVKWHTRMEFEEEDVRKLVLSLANPKVLMFVLKALLFGDKKELARTKDF